MGTAKPCQSFYPGVAKSPPAALAAVLWSLLWRFELRRHWHLDPFGGSAGKFTFSQHRHFSWASCTCTSSLSAALRRRIKCGYTLLSPMEAATDNSNLRKTRRISRACDYCHHRSIRCRASSAGSNGRCQNCVDFEQPCTYDRPAKRRGAKARGQSVSTLAHDGDLKSEDTSPGSWATNNISRQFTLTSPLEARSTSDLLNGISPSQWRPPNIATQSIVVDLVDIYFEVIYPMYAPSRSCQHI